MNRDSVNKEVLELSDKHKNLLIELPTGFGKSKLALDILKRHIIHLNQEVLIVVPRLVLIDTWKEEFEKWGMRKYLLSVTFVTYVSLPKKADKKCLLAPYIFLFLKTFVVIYQDFANFL